MAASNVAAQRRVAATLQPDNQQPEDTTRQRAAAAAVSPPAQATPPAKRPHISKRVTFKHLPAGFEQGAEPIGAVRETANGKAGTRPLVDVVYPPDSKPGSRISDSLKSLPDGNKTNKPSRRWTAPDHLTAEAYARKHGYMKDGAPRPAPARATPHARAPTEAQPPCPRRPT